TAERPQPEHTQILPEIGSKASWKPRNLLEKHKTRDSIFLVRAVLGCNVPGISRPKAVASGFGPSWCAVSNGKGCQWAHAVNARVKRGKAHDCRPMSFWL